MDIPNVRKSHEPSSATVLVFVDLENINQISKLEDFARNQTRRTVRIYKFASYLSTQQANATHVTRSANRDASDFHLALHMSRVLLLGSSTLPYCVVLTRDHFGAALTDLFTYHPEWSQLSRRVFHATSQEHVIQFILESTSSPPPRKPQPLSQSF